jgi:hypothetical protein
MKKILFGGAVFALSLLNVSCSNEDTEINSTDAVEINTPSSLRIGRTGVVAVFTNATDFQTGVIAAINYESTNDSLYILNNNTVTNIVNYFKIGNGEVLLMEKYYVNTVTKKIVRSISLDISLGEYVTQNIDIPYEGTPVETPILADCPPGTSFHGYCSGGQGDSAYQTCMGQIAAEFAFSNLVGGVPCGNFFQVNGLFDTTICWRACN